MGDHDAWGAGDQDLPDCLHCDDDGCPKCDEGDEDLQPSQMVKGMAEDVAASRGPLGFLRRQVKRLRSGNRALEKAATEIMQYCNEAIECPFCGRGPDSEEHEKGTLCRQLDDALNPTD